MHSLISCAPGDSFFQVALYGAHDVNDAIEWLDSSTYIEGLGFKI